MKRAAIIPTLLCVVLILLPVLILGHIRFHSSISRLPEFGKEVCPLKGLQHQVTVRLDGRGIPHIEAAGRQDLFFAQGYVEARDRFFQMDLARRRAEGNLSEIFGESTLEQDRLARLLRFKALAQRQVTELDPDEIEALAAFTEGVNVALEHYGNWIAPEIWATGISPPRWKVEDSLAIAAKFSFDVAASLSGEVSRWKEMTHYGPSMASTLWGWSSSGRSRSWMPPMDPALAPSSVEAVLEHLEGWGLPGSMAEANAWVLSGRMTSSGRNLLAVDPHGPVESVGTWYALDLRAPDFHVAGLGLPGLPGVIMGHNEDLAWAVSGSMMDVMDLYDMSLGENGAAELIDGKWVPLRTVREEIKVRWQDEPVSIKLHLSRNGPVIFEQRDRAMALRWSGVDIKHPLRPWLKMSLASSVAEVEKAWRDEPAPPLTLLAADREGHLLQQQLGFRPRRGRGAGKLPAPGKQSRWAWKGYESWAPGLVDPDSGFFIAANEDLFAEGEVPSRTAHFVGDFSSPWRARRLRDRFQRRKDWDIISSIALQRDVLSPRVLAMLKLLRPALEEFGKGETARLLDWDGKLEAESREALIYKKLLRAMGAEIGGDEAALSGMDETAFDADRCLKLLAGGLDGEFWDNRLTSEVEGPEEILKRAIQRIDSGMSSGTWGREHRKILHHPLHRFPLFGSLFSTIGGRSRLNCGGDDSTLFQTRWDPSRPFRLLQTPTAGFVTEVGDWDHSIVILPGGESGRLWSSHSQDDVISGLIGEARPLVFSRDAVEADSQAVMQLVPIGGERTVN